MQCYWLNKKENKELIVFFGGWGTDFHPFLPLQSSVYDVLMCYDYKLMQLPADFEPTIKSYANVTIIGWSLGVWVANAVCQPLQKYFNCAIAINGTLDPISDSNGISEAVFDGTLANLSPLNLIKFNRRMFHLPDERKQFEANLPVRNWQDLRDELAILKQTIEPSTHSIYQHALVGSNDLIFQTANQLRFWDDNVQIVNTTGSHFPFYAYQSWDEIVNSIQPN